VVGNLSEDLKDHIKHRVARELMSRAQPGEILEAKAE
jgi:hypothetical protein